MAPQGPQDAGRRSHSGLLAQTHAAGRHRSRVPRCGAGPPVLTGPPAPASRSPMAHCSCSLHAREGCGAWLTGSRRRRCAPRQHLAQSGMETSPLGEKRARPYPSRGPPPQSSRGTPQTHCPLQALSIVSVHPRERSGRSLGAVSHLRLLRTRPDSLPSPCRNWLNGSMSLR
jgi:hypothetical protein